MINLQRWSMAIIIIDDHQYHKHHKQKPKKKQNRDHSLYTAPAMTTKSFIYLFEKKKKND